MRNFTLSAALLGLAAFTTAQEIESEEIPSQCSAVCAYPLSVARQCNGDDDETELNCICSADNMTSQLPNCEACIAEFDESDNDVRDIVESCNFAVQSTYTTPGASTASATSTAVLTTTATASVSMTATEVVTVTRTSTSTATSTSTSDNDDDDEDDGTDSDGEDSGSDSDTGNGAIGMGIPALAVAGMVVLSAAVLL